MSLSEQQIKHKLSAAYNLLAMLGLDDHTYTHLTHRAPEQETFYMLPFGLKFAQVTPKNLLTINLAGDIVAGQEANYNITGYQTHGAIYKKRPDIQAIFHLHTPHMVAVASMQRGLLPISQWALHFYNQINYHQYDALVTQQHQGEQLANDLADKMVLLMRNHGAIIAGKTIHEAMFYTHHLELACKTQCYALATNEPLIVPDASTCARSVQTLLAFEKDLGKRDWQAWMWQLQQHQLRQHTNEYH